MGDKLILWGIGTKRTIRAHWALHELDLPYECRPIMSRSGETKSAEFTALNVRQKIPLLKDGDFRIGESAAIVAYLAENYARPNHSLIPAGKSQQAKWLEWCFFIIAELDSTSLYVMRRHGKFAHIYGDAPAVVDQAAEYFRHQLRFVDAALTDGRSYLMGEQFTTADIILGTCLLWATEDGVEIFDSTRAYLDRLTVRPAYLRAATANLPRTTAAAVR